MSVSNEEINDFKDRLKRSKLPPVLDPSVNLTYGYPSSKLAELRDAMLDLDWKEWEAVVSCVTVTTSAHCAADAPSILSVLFYR